MIFILKNLYTIKIYLKGYINVITTLKLKNQIKITHINENRFKIYRDNNKKNN